MQLNKRQAQEGVNKKWCVALAVGLIDHTFERVGNPESAAAGHFGVTGWQVKHVTFKGSVATVRYVGKSGVKQEKKVEDAALVRALKKAVKDKNPNDQVCGGVTAAEVNAYLKPYKVTAKDLRGYHANAEMRRRLTQARKGKLPTDKKKREETLKAEFKEALEAAAGAVGHEPATLRNQYLVPGLEDDFIKDGKVGKQGAAGAPICNADCLGTRTAAYDVLRHCPDCQGILHDGPRYHEHCDDCGYDLKLGDELERRKGQEWQAIPEDDPRLAVWRAQHARRMDAMAKAGWGRTASSKEATFDATMKKYIGKADEALAIFSWGESQIEGTRTDPEDVYGGVLGYLFRKGSEWFAIKPGQHKAIPMFSARAGIRQLRMQRAASSKVVYELYKALDDIDTADDICKEDDACYRDMVFKIHTRRFDILSEEAIEGLYATYHTAGGADKAFKKKCPAAQPTKTPDDQPATGDCYGQAANYMQYRARGNAVLVHGRPTLQCPPYVQYGHAWVEKGDTVIDPSNGFTGPRFLYYSLGNIDYRHNLVYTAQEAVEFMMLTEHYGPWEGVDGVPATGRQKKRWREGGVPLPKRSKRPKPLAMDMSSILQDRKASGSRMMYHIGKRPAQPRPATWDMASLYLNYDELPHLGGPAEGWRRPWLDAPVPVGVFLTPDPVQVAIKHYVVGTVYAYSVPEWVIKAAKGGQRLDEAAELLIPEPLWKYVKFVGTSASADDLAGAMGRAQGMTYREQGQRNNDLKWKRRSRARVATLYLYGTKSRTEKEDESAAKLIKPKPKKNPPRKDLRKRRLVEEDKDLKNPSSADNDRDLSLNYKRVAATRVAARWAAQEPLKPGKVRRTPGGMYTGKPKDGKKPARSFKDKEQAEAYAGGNPAPSGGTALAPQPGSPQEEDETATKTEEPVTVPKEDAKTEKEQPKKLRETLTDPMNVGNTPVSPTGGLTTEALRERSKAALEQFSVASPEDRQAAGQAVADKLKALPEGDPQREELDHILDGIALANIMRGDEEHTPGRPLPTGRFKGLVKAAIAQGRTDELLGGTLGTYNSTAHRDLYKSVYSKMDDTAFALNMASNSGNKGGLGILTEEDPETGQLKYSPKQRSRMRYFIMGLELDGITVGNAMATEATQEAGMEPSEMEAILARVDAEARKNVWSSVLLGRGLEDGEEGDAIRNNGRLQVLQAVKEGLEKELGVKLPEQSSARALVDAALEGGDASIVEAEVEPPLAKPR